MDDTPVFVAMHTTIWPTKPPPALEDPGLLIRLSVPTSKGGSSIEGGLLIRLFSKIFKNFQKKSIFRFHTTVFAKNYLVNTQLRNGILMTNEMHIDGFLVMCCCFSSSVNVALLSLDRFGYLRLFALGHIREGPQEYLRVLWNFAQIQSAICICQNTQKIPFIVSH